MQPRENAVGGHEGFAEQRVQLYIYKSSEKQCWRRVNWPNYNRSVLPRIWFLLHTLRTDTSPSTQTAIFIFGLHETKHPTLQNSNKLLHISQVGFVPNDWFGNKAIPFLVNKTGTIVQRTSVAVIWLSGKESATGQFHDGLRWSAMITSIKMIRFWK